MLKSDRPGRESVPGFFVFPAFVRPGARCPREKSAHEEHPRDVSVAGRRPGSRTLRHGRSGGWVGVRVRRSRDRVCVTVEDRGPGIAAEDARQVFEPFFRGHGSERTSGAGLGLAIVREIAAAHGGSVVLEKRESGAAFTIQLPAVTGA